MYHPKGNLMSQYTTIQAEVPQNKESQKGNLMDAGCHTEIYSRKIVQIKNLRIMNIESDTTHPSVTTSLNIYI